MEPVLGVALLFGLFAATHFGLASVPVRRVLERRLGRWGFTWLFSCIAAVTFGVAVAHAALHRMEGPPGLALGRFEVLRALLVTAIVLGTALMAASLADYARSPFSLRGEHVRAPVGFQRVTRHGFLLGVGLFGGAHALLATKLVGAIAMGALAAIALVGARLQDRKLLALRGESYATYLARTSTLPFAAALAGRTRIVWRELPIAGLVFGVVLAFLLRAVHARVFDYGGLFVIVPVVGGAFLLLVREWRGERRARDGRAPADASRRAKA
jgi:uncharacterized membrane protein